MSTRWTRKDLLGLRELSPDEINFVLDTTDAFKQVGTREIKKVPALRGKTLVNFFVEPSTRTRTSFELAAFRLSADVINISATTSSLTKGETLKDTARNLEALQADIIVLRHSSAGAPQFLAQGTLYPDVIESRSVHETVEMPLDHLPPTLRLVIASRTDPPWPLPLWRVRRM